MALSTGATCKVVEAKAKDILHKHCDGLSRVLAVSSPLLQKFAELLYLEKILPSHSFARVKDLLKALLEACEDFEVLKKIADVLLVGHSKQLYKIGFEITKDLGESLDIGDLIDVINALKCHKVSNKKWNELGLQLGLIQPTLDDIEADQGTRGVQKCMQAMLTRWLERQDNVMKKGIPSWKTLVQALESINNAAAESIKQEKCEGYSHHDCSHHTRSQADITDPTVIESSPIVIEINLSPNDESIFIKLRKQLTSLYLKIKPKLLAKITSKEHLQECLELSYEHLVPLISQADTVDEMLKIVLKECSVTNIAYLEAIIEHFEVTEAESDVSDYHEHIKKQCSHLPIENIEKHHLRSPQSSRLICNTIKFIVNWKTQEKQLKDIEGVLWKAFGDMAAVVQVDTVKKVNSFAIICYAPHTMMAMLMVRARDNIDVLIEEGVMSLFVGYYTVLDHTQIEIRAMKKEISILTEEANVLRKLKIQSTAVHAPQSTTDETKPQEEKPHDTDEKDIRFEYNQQLTELSKMCSDYKAQIELKNSALIEKDRHLVDRDEKLADLKKETTTVKEMSRKKDLQIKDLNQKLDSSKNEAEKLKKYYEEEISRTKEEAKNEITRLEAMVDEDKREKWEMQKTMDTMQEAFDSIYCKRIPALFSLKAPEHSVVPVNVIMPKFTERSKSEEPWFSPPFYTAEEGYKLCLKILAKGDDYVRNHASVHVHLMAGENDDHLTWPINGEVQLTLASRKGSDLIHRVRFDRKADPDSYNRVLVAGTHMPYGFASRVGIQISKFAPHSDFSHDSPYLIDDVLPVQVDFVSLEAPSPPLSPSLEHSSSQIQLLTTDIIMPQFTKHKEAADEYKSDSFYSHKNGYKFVLLIYANGLKEAQSKGISLYVHLLKGENDNKLKFPFRGELLVQVLNSRGDNFNVEQSVMFDERNDPDKKYGGQVRFFDRAIYGYGFNDFIRHDVLPFQKSTNTQYLRDDDSLHFRIICKSVASIH